MQAWRCLSSVRGPISRPLFTTSDQKCVEFATSLSPDNRPGQHVVTNNVLILGVGQADEAEMKLIASTPYRTHVYSAATFDGLRSVQRDLIPQVCAAVEAQLNSLVSGDEGETWWRDAARSLARSD